MKSETFFSRLQEYFEGQGVKNINRLAEELGYNDPQKLYRLMRNSDAKPSYGIIVDISNRFPMLNLRWLLTGEGSKEIEKSTHTPSASGGNSDEKGNIDAHTPTSKTGKVHPTGQKSVHPTVHPTSDFLQIIEAKNQAIDALTESNSLLREKLNSLEGK